MLLIAAVTNLVDVPKLGSGNSVSVWFPLVTGGLAGALVSFVLNTGMEWFRRKDLTNKLKLEFGRPHELKLAGTVENSGTRPVRKCWIYVTVECTDEDKLDPPNGKLAFVTRKSPYLIKDARTCWSYAGASNNPAVMDIYSKERQTFELLEIAANGDWIKIFSEAYDNPCRVYLNARKTYRGEIRIVSEDTIGKSFVIEIDPSDRGRPVKIIE